jgi:uncharacterized membrane protein
MNQGLYNGYLAAGLIWGLTAKTSFLLTQALPGPRALLLVLAAGQELRDKKP